MSEQPTIKLPAEDGAVKSAADKVADDKAGTNEGVTWCVSV
jgi:hypothetical protein